MGKGKPRHDPDKPQNNYGGNYDCDAYDNYGCGREFCHHIGHNPEWDEYVKWMKVDDNNKLICKGNRHKCNKDRMHWLASLPEKEREKYKNSFDNTSNRRINKK